MALGIPSLYSTSLLQRRRVAHPFQGFLLRRQIGRGTFSSLVNLIGTA
jgi:hypothetical protein